MRVVKSLIATYILVILCLVGCFTAGHNVAYASEVVEFDYTNVLDDLKSDESFDITDYEYDQNGYMQLIYLSEYSYSYINSKQSNYGIYLYMYNPGDEDIITNSVFNKIQLATAFDDEGNAIEFTKYPITCLSSSMGDYYNLFYKFKVSFSADEKDDFLDMLNSNERNYAVSGIELLLGDDLNATDIGIGCNYNYSGYSAGYGPDTSAESTLTYTCEEFKTLELDVHDTYYRAEGTNAYNTYAQLNTVYFSVPKAVADLYDLLYAVKAEWYEYVTTPMFLTGNNTVYSAMQDYIGVDNSAYYGSDSHENSNLDYGFIADNFASSVNGDAYWKYIYNVDGLYSNDSYPTTYIDMLTWLFYVDSWSSGDVLVTSDELIEYALEYSADKSDLINGKYSTDLFGTDVGEGRTAGYNSQEITAEDNLSFDSFVVGDSWWEKLFGSGTTTTYDDLDCIYTLSDDDFSGSDIYNANNLYVAENDIEELEEYYNNATDNDEVVYLYRFAVTDYYYSEGYNMNNNEGILGVLGLFADNYLDEELACVTQNAFLDFDIISLTYEKEGEYTVYACVSNPIDIISDITAMSDSSGFDWLKLFIVLVSLLLIFFIGKQIYKKS